MIPEFKLPATGMVIMMIGAALYCQWQCGTVRMSMHGVARASGHLRAGPRLVVRPRTNFEPASAEYEQQTGPDLSDYWYW